MSNHEKAEYLMYACVTLIMICLAIKTWSTHGK